MRILVFILVCWAQQSLYAQVPCSLPQKSRQEHKKNLKARLKYLEQELSKSQQAHQTGLSLLNTLSLHIQATKDLITTLHKELKDLDIGIQESSSRVRCLHQELGQLKKEYAAMVHQGTKALYQMSPWMFVLSADSFHELVQRIKHVQQYARVRKHHALSIQQTLQRLQSAQKTMQEKRHKQVQLLQEKKQEQASLQEHLHTQRALVTRLQGKRKQLEQELATQRKAMQALHKLTHAVVQDNKAAPLPKASVPPPKAPADTRVPYKPPPSRPVSPWRQEQWGKALAAMRGKLSWPVHQGIISAQFGTSAHLVLKGVQVENLGIDIQTPKGAQVYSVFQGVVRAIGYIPGMGHAVILQHGSYHTVYARLQKTHVHTGQVVDAHTLLGIVQTNDEESTVLQFQLWRSEQHLNPARWLKQLPTPF